MRDQDVEVLPENVIRLRHGVAKERRISVDDGQFRHGRKSRSQWVDGYKRHILRDLDNKLVRVVGLTPANVPEAEVAAAIEEDLAAQQAELSELYIDRTYCPLRLQCTCSSHGRSISIHPDEPVLAELRERHQTKAGRAKLRERVAVEHTLAHIGHWQGDRARYRGQRKNLCDLRRVAVVHNLHVLDRLIAGQQLAAA